MISILDLPVPVEIPSRQPVPLWDTDGVRPKWCPSCKTPCRDGEGRLSLHAHGSYDRQVLGLVAGRVLRIWIPRFLCRMCGATTSILPSWLHPWRWYSIGTIIETLWLWSSGRATAGELRARFGAWPEGAGWKSVHRWARDFLVSPTLLGWMRLPVAGATRLCDRLHRFLFQVQPGGPAVDGEWSAQEVRGSGQGALAGSGHRPLSCGPAAATFAPGVQGASPAGEPDATFPHRRSLVAS